MVRAALTASITLLAWGLVCGTSACAEEPASGVSDEPFWQEYRDAFAGCESPHSVVQPPVELRDARAVAVDQQGIPWIATGAGVWHRPRDAWVQPTGPPIAGPVFDLLVEPDGTVWVAAWNGLYVYDGQMLERVAAIDGPIGVLAADGLRLVALGPDGAWQRAAAAGTIDADHTGSAGNAELPRSPATGWEPLPHTWPTSARDAVFHDGALWVASEIGLYRADRMKGTRRYFEETELASADVRALAVAPDGALWVGSSGGIDVLVDGEPRRRIVGGVGELPCGEVRALAFDGEGRPWVGTALGVARLDADGWTLRHSLRWLPNDDVQHIALEGEGTAWVATAGGVATLRRRPMTLAAKAEHYQRIVAARHVRQPGLVEKCVLAQQGDLNTWSPTDTDNDGQYTGMYLAAEAYRYAATLSEEARAGAVRAFEALVRLQTVTGTTGFIARTMIPANWTRMADPNHEYTPAELAEIRVDDPRYKDVPVRWRPSADGKWMWKGDTSSDEITGHFYAYGVFFDLVADSHQQRQVADHVRRVIDHIIEGGYVLRDTDGEPTRWGVWSSERLNGDPNWRLDRGVNSVEILSYLLLAHHVTGDERYLHEVGRLFDEQGYGANVRRPQADDPASFTHIDSELLALAFPALVSYESDTRRRAAYLEGVQQWFAVNRRDASPYYNFVYGEIVGRDFDVEAAVAQLRDWPWDMVQWTVDNRQREDLRLVRRPAGSHWQTDRLLPPDERAVLKWDSNPFSAVRGEDGRTEDSTVSYLLPYWIGRLRGFIGPPSEEIAPDALPIGTSR